MTLKEKNELLAYLLKHNPDARVQDLDREIHYREDLEQSLTDDQKWEMKVKQLAKLAKP